MNICKHLNIGHEALTATALVLEVVDDEPGSIVREQVWFRPSMFVIEHTFVGVVEEHCRQTVEAETLARLQTTLQTFGQTRRQRYLK